MRTKILLVVTTLVGAVALLLVLLLRVDTPPAPIVEAHVLAPEVSEPQTNWSSTFIEDRERRVASEPERAPVAQPSHDEPEPTDPPLPKDRIVELFESLNLSSGYWNAFHSMRAFTATDLSHVRSLVEKHGLGAWELIETFRRLDESSELRPMIVLACAFSGDVKPMAIDRLQLLAGIDHDARTLHEGNLVSSSSFAATLALWMLDAQSELASVARESLSRYVDLSPLENRPARSAFLRDSAALALDTIDVAKSAELRRHLEIALGGDPNALVTQSAWRLHGRSADRAARMEILDQARAGHGPARFALEDIRAEAFSPALEDLARSVHDSEPGNALGASACVALLSTGTSKSWRAFERLSRDMQRRTFPWEALGRVDRPQNLASLLHAASRRARSKYDEAFKSMVEASLAATHARLDRCTVPRSAVRATCFNLREVAYDFTEDPQSLEIALRVLARHGDDNDRRLVWSMSRYLSDSALKDVQASLAGTR